MNTLLLNADESGIAQAAEVIRRGGLVAFPTETVYGLGADALSADAVARVFEVKGRPRFDPTIVHVASQDEVRTLWKSIPPLAQTLMDRFWPGPLTLVLPKAKRVPDIVTAGLPTVAVRMPSHPVALQLIRASDRPIAAPSANRFGRSSPTHHEHVLSDLDKQVEAALAAGPTDVGIESTVLSLAESPPRLLRPGGTALEALRELVPDLSVNAPVSPSSSPGTLPRHYLPHTPLFLLEPGAPGGSSEYLERRRCGMLAFKEPWKAFSRVEQLSASGDLREAAAQFFAALRRLDAADLTAIVAEPVPEEGLGLAIADRLRRASSGRARLAGERVWILR
ncbi:MAG: L-threonylcarbamoyladenylate synthase [Candidatus Bipolaricaulota bacterium]